MNTQKLILTGATHPICQDYGVVSEAQGHPFMIVSDGCSSSQDTDFGSRLLVKSMEGLLKDFLPVYSDHYLKMLEESTPVATSLAYTSARQLNLPIEALDATLLAGIVKDGHFSILMAGDGYFIRKLKGIDELLITEVSYEKNYPIYPSYFINPALKERLSELEDNRKIAKDYVISLADGFVLEYYQYAEGNNAPFTRYEDELDKYEFFALASDGLGSFFKKTDRGQIVQLGMTEKAEAWNKLFKFRTTAGEFLTRAWKGFGIYMDNRYGKGLWGHYDDLTITCLINK